MVVIVCVRCGADHEAKRSDAQFCTKCRKEVVLERDRKRSKENKLECISCHEFKVDRHYPGGRCKQCENKRRGELQVREGNPNWKGGRSTSRGYITVLVDGHHEKEHKVVWEKENGPMHQGYVIHHMNGDKTDNRLENLLALPRHKHHQEPRAVIAIYEEKIQRLEEEIALLKLKGCDKQ